MIYTGGFFEGESFVDAFSNSDASVGLVYGSVIALLITIVFYLITKVLTFEECMNAVPEGFKSMVPAILVLTFAWTLKSMTDSLGAATYVAGLVENVAGNGALMSFLPALVFVVGAFLAFATGTSWGTFGILIPIVVNVFGADLGNELMIIAISACMAGAVCGDHCSPISDTTIMASAGGQCNHINHVSTQLPYALTAAAVSFVTYIVAGFARTWFVSLPVGIVLMVGTLLTLKKMDK
jgi:Na+/H+ antiporter NhaC